MTKINFTGMCLFGKNVDIAVMWNRLIQFFTSKQNYPNKSEYKNSKIDFNNWIRYPTYIIRMNIYDITK